jgi:hypothetical protein
VPISVEGRPWGLILVAYTRDQLLPADTEARLTHVHSAAGAGTHITVDLPREYESTDGAG